MDKAFTWICRLLSGLMRVLSLRKHVKSVQNAVNEALSWLRVDSVWPARFRTLHAKTRGVHRIGLNPMAGVETLYSNVTLGHSRAFASWAWTSPGVSCRAELNKTLFNYSIQC